MKSTCARGFKKQMRKGFTLVELAIVLVIVGIILLAVLKGTDAINKAKAERAAADLRGLQAMILEYHKRTGRLPGDCNNDGKIAFTPLAGVHAAATLDNTEANRILPSPAVDFATDPLTANCATPTASEAGINVLWNDLRRNNIVDSQRLPAELAKNSNGSFYAVGTMTAGTNNANVIVAYDIPIWMAEAIDTAIDGVVSYSGAAATAEAAPNSGRIRRWDANGGSAFVADATYDNGFARSASGETRDTLISISYQFDVNKLPN